METDGESVPKNGVLGKCSQPWGMHKVGRDLLLLACAGARVSHDVTQQKGCRQISLPDFIALKRLRSQ